MGFGVAEGAKCWFKMWPIYPWCTAYVFMIFPVLTCIHRSMFCLKWIRHYIYVWTVLVWFDFVSVLPPFWKACLSQDMYWDLNWDVLNMGIQCAVKDPSGLDSCMQSLIFQTAMSMCCLFVHSWEIPFVFVLYHKKSFWVSVKFP